MSLLDYPKILPLGHKVLKQMFEGVVEVTEKLDGSQIKFGKIAGELKVSSRRKQFNLDKPDSLFQGAVDHIKRQAALLPDGIVFYAEALQKPHHNVLSYNTVPKNHVALFAAAGRNTELMMPYYVLRDWASRLRVDLVPLLFQGVVKGPDQLLNLLEHESYLGGPKIEGIVAKNYTHTAIGLDDTFYPYLVGKFVSEKFKEKMDEKKEKKPVDMQGDLQEYFKLFATEARWQKAVQHLKDDGKLIGDPKDIGILIKELSSDFIEECKEEIQDRLWNSYSKQVLHHVIDGFPQWYKEQIFRGNIDVD